MDMDIWTHAIDFQWDTVDRSISFYYLGCFWCKTLSTNSSTAHPSPLAPLRSPAYDLARSCGAAKLVSLPQAAGCHKGTTSGRARCHQLDQAPKGQQRGAHATSELPLRLGMKTPTERLTRRSAGSTSLTLVDHWRKASNS